MLRDSDDVQLGSVTVIVVVNDVNEEPAFVGTDFGRNIDENAQTESLVGAPVMATDQDAGASGEITFSIGNKVPFSIATTKNADGSGYSGQISVDGTIAIAASPYTVTVVATDGGGSDVKSKSQDITISLADINDAPTFDNDDGETSPTLHVTIAENSPAGTDVAII